MNRAVILLPIVLGATGGIAAAQDSMTQHRQSSEDGWVVSQTTSPIDYSPIATATTSSRNGAGESAMQLSIRCRSGRTELVLTGPGISRGGGDDAISYRINDNPAVQVAAATPTFGPGVAFTGDVVRLLQSLPDSGDLMVLVSKRGGNAHDGTFSLAGLDEARAKIAAACKWPRAIATPGQ
ncbi:hypothetical protein [Bradyrhizobium iriomotense]|uniref:hypothetical protein n=1 Tax=Bradyrhizobium iriomotense TaxID=441950 RepID=UPI001B8A0FAB|nr:hypothetical protein [Bradyrhizobium iriomotense]MBR1132217.1 hypothetical protein [Bradyrhizobium iriomotense]